MGGASARLRRGDLSSGRDERRAGSTGLGAARAHAHDPGSRAGVDPERLHRIPGGIDTDVYHPDVEPLTLGGRGFRFLSVFDWSLRKGWDVLLRAYLEEFDADEDVTLLIKVFSEPPKPVLAD